MNILTPNDSNTIISLDGCHSGWFYILINSDNHWKSGIVEKIESLYPEICKSNLTLIDIPIGLKSTGQQERLCDLEARKILTKRKSSIFPAPHKSSLNCSSYLEACQVNLQHFSRKLSRQSWAILSKIREVNDFILAYNLSGKVREMHPEICFWALNGKKEMMYNKKRREGFQERFLLLRRIIPFAGEIVEYSLNKFRRKDLAKDDILDALSGIAIATQRYSIKTIPEVPEIDTEGLPMEMVYADKSTH